MADKNSHPAESRKRAYRMGLGAEILCALYFLLRGYRILGRRYKTRAGEIDLVLGRGNRIVYVEVKYRAEKADAVFAVSARQKRRVVRAAGLFLAHHPQFAACDQRFDLFVLSPWSLPRHIANAWQECG